jgi:hypothetical protein
MEDLPGREKINDLKNVDITYLTSRSQIMWQLKLGITLTNLKEEEQSLTYKNYI